MKTWVQQADCQYCYIFFYFIVLWLLHSFSKQRGFGTIHTLPATPVSQNYFRCPSLNWHSSVTTLLFQHWAPCWTWFRIERRLKSTVQRLEASAVADVTFGPSYCARMCFLLGFKEAWLSFRGKRFCVVPHVTLSHLGTLPRVWVLLLWAFIFA